VRRRVNEAIKMTERHDGHAYRQQANGAKL